MTGQKRRIKFHNVKASKKRHNGAAPSSQEALTGSEASRQGRSRLEDLPTELLRSIFLYSANYDLPLVSRTLLNQLSDTRMAHSIVKSLLRSFEGEAYYDCTWRDQKMVRGMFERRFFSLDLFRDCYYQILMEDGDVMEHSDAVDDSDASSVQYVAAPMRSSWPPLDFVSDELREWFSGNEKQRQLPLFKTRFEDYFLDLLLHACFFSGYPSRYLRSPWSEDKFRMLEVFSCLCVSQRRKRSNDRIYKEDGVSEHTSESHFRSALNDAVDSNCLKATKLLCDINVPIQQEHLRTAVKYASHEPNIFSFLLHASLDASNIDPKPADGPKSVIPDRRLDYLDPTLWRWATEMKRAGDERGDIVMDQLKVAAKDQAVCLSYLPQHNRGLWPWVPRYEAWLKGERFE